MIRIVTDSTSDITQDMAKELGIDVVPLTVSFGNEAFIDGVTITMDEFYSRLKNGDVLPKTSQPSPVAFEEVYKKYINAGDEIISIHISSELSGTGQSAKIAADAVSPDKISVIDSLNATGGQDVLVRIAIALRDQGLSREEIVARLNEYIPRIRLLVIVNTLEYLKKGGRIRPAIATFGDVISLHPVLTLVDGLVEIPAKIIGDKATIKWLVRHIDEDAPEPGLPVIIGHSAAPEKAADLKAKLEAKGVENIVDTIQLGSVIGTYTGPGSIGMFYIARK